MNKNNNNLTRFTCAIDIVAQNEFVALSPETRRKNFLEIKNAFEKRILPLQGRIKPANQTNSEELRKFQVFITEISLNDDNKYFKVNVVKDIRNLCFLIKLRKDSTQQYHLQISKINN